MNTLKSIVIKDYTKAREERLANAALSPGHLVELMSTDKVRMHSTAGHIAVKWFALEDELQGKGIDDAYAADAVVQIGGFRGNDQVNALIADGESIAIGDFLCSNGDGTLKKWLMADSSDLNETSPDALANWAASPIALALEALDLSSSSGEESTGLIGDRRAKVMIL